MSWLYLFQLERKDWWVIPVIILIIVGGFFLLYGNDLLLETKYPSSGPIVYENFSNGDIEFVYTNDMSVGRDPLHAIVGGLFYARSPKPGYLQIECSGSDQTEKSWNSLIEDKLKEYDYEKYFYKDYLIYQDSDKIVFSNYPANYTGSEREKGTYWHMRDIYIRCPTNNTRPYYYAPNPNHNYYEITITYNERVGYKCRDDFCVLYSIFFNYEDYIAANNERNAKIFDEITNSVKCI